jgi:hypothetical protein
LFVEVQCQMEGVYVLPGLHHGRPCVLFRVQVSRVEGRWKGVVMSGLVHGLQGVCTHWRMEGVVWCGVVLPGLGRCTCIGGWVGLVAP